MTTIEFITNFVDPVCHKEIHSLDEFQDIKKNPATKQIKATTFYQIYSHNVFGEDEDRLSMRDFFRLCSQYLYYDKYVCTHGTEFYYHIIFSEENTMYQLTKSLIDKRIEANNPETLFDLEYIIEAVSK